MAFINTVYELRKQNPEAAAYVDELVAEGMEPLAAFEQAKREYGIGTLDAPAVSSDFDTPIQPSTDELDITMPTFGEEVDDSLAVEPDFSSSDLVEETTPVQGPPVEATQPAGNGRSAIMQALAAMGQRPAVEAPVVQPPDSRLRILQALSKAGSGLLGLRDQSRTEKRNRASQATANVINALSKGRAGARGLQEEARPGLLTQLAAVPGQVAGAGLKFQTDRQAAEQSEFANQLKARQLEFDEAGAESERIRAEASLHRAKRTTGKAPNELFTQQGIDYFNQRMTREQATEALRKDPDLGPMLDANPDLLGRMLKGHEAGRTGTTKEALAEASATRAQSRFEQEEIDRLTSSYSTSLKEVAIQGDKANPVIQSPKDFFRGPGVDVDALQDVFGVAGVARMKSDRMAAKAIWWKARTDHLKIERDKEKENWNRDFKKTKEEFDREMAEQRLDLSKESFAETQKKQRFREGQSIFKAIISLPGIKSYSGPQGIGGSYNRLRGVYEDYLDNPKAHRGAFHAAIVNQFQRMIDPATVREGDVTLLREAQSWFDQVESQILRIGSGGFLADDMIDGMMEVDERLHQRQLGVVKGEIVGALEVYNKLPGLESSLDGLDIEGMADLILGGAKVYSEGVEYDEDL